MKYNKTYLARRLVLSLIIGGMFVSSAAYALPQGGSVVGGSNSGTIGGSGNIMDITGKGNNNVAIRWEQFNIANGETVNFKNMASVLNYVTGNTKSEIYGALNGQGVNVFLFNPNGILFGKGAAVNVGSLHASTGKMTDENINGFNGTPTVDLSNVTADVLNLGVIRADKVTIEGVNISLGNAADIQKQNGDAVTAADKANYVLKADGTINVGYETTGTKTFSVIENGTSTDHTIRDYNTGAADKGSTLFTGSKINGSDCMLISDIYELQNIQDDRTGRYMLTNNIAGAVTKTWNNGAGFTPLHASTSWKFLGVFDGLGYTISDLYINNSTSQYGGLFGVSAGKIANVQLTGIDYTFTGSVIGAGGLVGYNVGVSNIVTGSVRNVQTDGKIVANNLTSMFNYIGGIVGVNGNTVQGVSGTPTPTNAVCIIQNAVSNVDITADGATNLYVGGIAGYNSYSKPYNETGVIKNVKNAGTITVTNSSQGNTGGIVGTNNGGQVSKAENTGAVTGTWHVGGILGYSNNSDNTNVVNSELHNSGTVTGVEAFSYAGGIVGQVYQGKFEDISNSGAVIVNATNTGYAGGIIGHNSSTNSSGSFTNLSNSGAVTITVGISGYAGGIFGENDAALEFEKFNNSGTIKGNGWIGGIIGYNNGGAIKNSYNTGVVAGTGAGALQLLVGGIVGNNNSGNITNVYNTGAVSADKGTSTKTCFAGGIVAGNKGQIKNTYNTGSVKVENGAIGNGIVAAGNGVISNAFYFDPATQLYYDYSGNTYVTTEDFNTAFMTGAAANGEQDAWLGYSAGQSTPLLQGFLSPLDISVGDIEIEITAGTAYTDLAQAVIDKLTAMGVDFDPSKIKALEVKEAGTYDLSALLYSTQDGYKITVGDGGKLTVTIKTEKPGRLPVDPSVIDSASYKTALINVQHTDDELKAVRQKLESEKRAEDEAGRVRIQGTGIRM
ncbi:filamentous hemagglutinin N-terminal domain-containing protein [uncultured Phascolarctobacterium sp.]|uniref:filamentous hemagglutinin N-terminal domain-containing protein n=1 Tax=uncultured Phascolarctobacterium sp. TaxID=512296 RepID=UPI002638C17E|nr:filamentous hemagglutinin N-terminal domain-containing protein [uncultured Phascolarctobacterium sp.]